MLPDDLVTRSEGLADEITKAVLRLFVNGDCEQAPPRQNVGRKDRVVLFSAQKIVENWDAMKRRWGS